MATFHIGLCLDVGHFFLVMEIRLGNDHLPREAMNAGLLEAWMVCILISFKWKEFNPKKTALVIAGSLIPDL